MFCFRKRPQESSIRFSRQLGLLCFNGLWAAISETFSIPDRHDCCSISIVEGIHQPFREKPIDEAENGAIAVAMFKAGAYDLVLMDIEMPIMDGYAATRAIRAIENETAQRHVPILALTASVLAEALGRALDAGCDAHIPKPVKKATLLAAIHKAISDAERAANRPPT